MYPRPHHSHRRPDMFLILAKASGSRKINEYRLGTCLWYLNFYDSSMVQFLFGPSQRLERCGTCDPLQWMFEIVILSGGTTLAFCIGATRIGFPGLWYCVRRSAQTPPETLFSLYRPFGVLQGRSWLILLHACFVLD